MGMIRLGLFIGIYTYGIFLLGITMLLQNEILLVYSGIFWIGIVLVYFRKFLVRNFQFPTLNRFGLLIICVICVSIIVNLIGALGPELAFDSLWYHLTLPKLYLENQEIYFIPGGLLYYSPFPKLTELLYVVAFSFSNEILAKLFHFSFGILGMITVYLLSTQFLTKKLSLLVVAILASNLVFAWEMTTSFNDLTWMFYEILSFFSFVLFMQIKKTIYLLLTGVFIGFSIMTKVVAVISLVIFLLLLLYWFRKNILRVFALSPLLLIPSLLIPLPWFLFSYIHTQNPFYPFFTGYLQTYESSFITLQTLNPLSFLTSFISLFLFSSDPISPVYVMFLPIVMFVFSKLSSMERLVYLYCAFAFVLWYLAPDSGGARFILPYLPVFSLVVGITISKFSVAWRGISFEKISIIIVLSVLLITILYRGVSNVKYLPYLLGIKTKSEFLTENLKFDFGDFYDVDGYFVSNISKHDMVLLIGFHNLYYVDFPFVHQSWYTGQAITHVATQNSELPSEYKGWELVYENEKTFVKLYKKQF